MLGSIIRVLSRWWHYLLRRRAIARWHRDLRERCDAREQRLEDADLPPILMDLHALVYSSFREPSATDGELHEMLDQYVTLMIHRNECRGLQRLAGTRRVAERRELAHVTGHTLSAVVLDRRYELSIKAELASRELDREIADLESLIRLYCERALFSRSTSTTLRRAPSEPVTGTHADG